MSVSDLDWKEKDRDFWSEFSRTYQIGKGIQERLKHDKRILDKGIWTCIFNPRVYSETQNRLSPVLDYHLPIYISSPFRTEAMPYTVYEYFSEVLPPLYFTLEMRVPQALLK